MITAQASKATVRVLAGTALGVLPLKGMFTNSGWLVDSWLTMAIVVLPAALLRARYRPGSWQLLPGLVLGVFFLTARFLPAHATLGFIPSLATSSDVGRMTDLVRSAMSDQSAPVHAGAAITFYLAGGLGLLAAVIDIVAMSLRAPAITGIAFLLGATVSGAVTRHAVGWFWIAAAAIGYLLVLSSGSGIELARWGRQAPDAGGHSALRSRAGESGRRIAVISLIASLVVASIVPMPSGNVLADALHHNGDGGKGNGTRVYLDPLATLRGQLTRSSPVDLFSVAVSNAQGDEPFYLREEVLETYTGTAWVPAGGSTDTRPLQSGRLTGTPAVHLENTPKDTFTATITVRGLGGAPALFYFPSTITGRSDWQWDSSRELVAGKVGRNQTYVEEVQQPRPTTEQLDAAPAVDSTTLLKDLELPADIPASVAELVTTNTRDAVSPYAKALAIFNYFADPANNFTYSLNTKAGDSGSDLADFLTNRQGYCQQYAAAMAVMLRLARIPSRVVLGYTHSAPDKNGRFTVTSNDAHAWVEAYFSGIGWVPFDPTPLAGTDAARAVALPWAARNTGNADANPTGTGNVSVPTVTPPPADTGGNTASPASTHSGDTVSLGGVVAVLAALVLLVLVSVPASVRWIRRRRRWAAARGGRPLALWDELRDTCLDLGIGWSLARSPRQVVVWLREFGLDRTGVIAMRELADAIEIRSYGPGASSNELTGEDLVKTLRVVRSELTAAADRSKRWRMRLWPVSVFRRADGRQPVLTNQPG